MIATPLARSGGPLYPVRCPVCDRLLGAFYRNGLSLTAHATACTDRCMALWAAGHGRADWRELPAELRQVQLATWMVDHAVKKAQSS